MALTHSQAQALAAVEDFLRSDAPCFLLKGSAGTGKTTLVASVIERLKAAHRRFAPLAPTGRAARILGSKVEERAGTVHGEIYTLEEVQVFEEARTRNDPGIRFVFPLRTEDAADTVFIVDESSMVGDKETEADVFQFGSGRLLTDLIEYARLNRPGREAGRGARLILVGDPAQLPPVGDAHSPALSAEYLRRTFGLDCREFELTEVMRQASGSAILQRATALREAIARQDFNGLDLSEAEGEIRHVGLRAALDEVVEALRARSSSVLITYTNAAALELNRAVRARLWSDEGREPQRGDLLLVNKNAPLVGLMNGDLVKLTRVAASAEVRQVPIKGIEHPVPLSFRAVTVAYRDAGGHVTESDCLILENLLDSKDRELSPLEQRALLVDFRQRHPDLRPRTAEFRAAIRQDPWFNALQVKYGYALTCHKAQGGEWDTVVVNFSDVGGDPRNAQFFRWTYTALTRARRRLLLIEPPAFKPLSRIRFDALPPTAPQPVPQPAVAAATDGAPTDLDWDRFGFAPGQEALFRHHVRMREALSSLGIGIARVQHGQFFERYALARDGASAAVQYAYKADHRVSRVVAAPGAASDPALLQACLACIGPLLLAPGGACEAEPAAFLLEFRRQVEQAVAASGLRVVAMEPDSYRLRLTFEGDGRRGRVDFWHDDKKRWTRAMEVGKPGSSQGIYQQVSQALGIAP